MAPTLSCSQTGYLRHTHESWNLSVAAFWTHVYVAWEDCTPVSGSGTIAPEAWMRVSLNNRVTRNIGESRSASVAATDMYVYVSWQDDTAVSGSSGKSEADSGRVRHP